MKTDQVSTGDYPEIREVGRREEEKAITEL